MPFSHHSHSGEFCPSHARNSLEEVIQKAIAQGMETFCLSEHMPRSADQLYQEEVEAGFTSDWFVTNEAEYFKKAVQMRNKYVSKINIIIGFESEWIEAAESLILINDSLARFPFEFFVGSVHHVHHVPIDLGRDLYLQAREISGGTEERIFEDYFEAQFDMLRHLKPPVVGHFDLIRLYCDDPDLQNGGFKTWPRVWEMVLRNLKFISCYGGLLELNSAALRKGLNMPYPAADICQEFLNLQGRFCLSDDSHGIDHVGSNYHELLEFMQQQGINELHHLELSSTEGDEGVDARFPRTLCKSRSITEVKEMVYWRNLTEHNAKI
ncbi:polymerase/histidinol phosphatase-like protein [Aspergillus pseudoustus]|uniref:Histidinol-phosphatase n=1 Tax=Aspergillus pseudoustus TaxID=1810923 RepID=A0ABR4JGW1_9EURO